MNYQNIIEKGLSLGLTEVEVYESNSVSNQINLFQGKVDTYNLSNTKTLSIRGKFNGQMGYASTESFDEQGINECLENVLKNAKYLSSNEPDFMFEGGAQYVEVTNPKADFDDVTYEEKVQFLAALEQRLCSFDERIVNVELTYMERASKVRLVNSFGVDLTKEYSYMVFYASVVATDGQNTSAKYEADVNTKFSKLDADRVFNDVTEKVMSSLGAGFVETGKYPVVLSRDVASNILSAFSSVFSGESAMRKMSILVDKKNQQVFGKNITIINDPFTDKAIFKEAFDDEGVPCKTIEVVKDGVFTGFFHNLRSAKFFNEMPTGNGFRHGASTSVAPVNLHIQEGSKSEEEIIASIEKGILITEVNGLHAGLNPISGNFNVQSSGYLIENGQKAAPITLFVISSNFYEMLNNVVEVANNTEPNFNGTASPSLYIREVQVSGK